MDALPASEKKELHRDPFPSASSSSSSSSMASSSLLWPFSDRRLGFYFDPYSPNAAFVKSMLEKKALVVGSRSTITSSPSLATHILLDPSCSQNLQLRTLPSFVVNLEWLKDSFLAEEALPEKDYAVRIPLSVAGDETEEEHEDQEEFVNPGHPEIQAAKGKGGLFGEIEEEMEVWVEVEVEEEQNDDSEVQLQSPPVRASSRRRFLSSQHSSESDSDHSTSSLRSFAVQDGGGSEEEEDYEEEEAECSDASELELQDARRPQNSPSSSSTLRGTGNSWSWSEREKRKHAVLIANSADENRTEVARRFHDLYPHRSIKAILQHRRQHEKMYKRLVDQIERERGSDDDEAGQSEDGDDSELNVENSARRTLHRWPQVEDQDLVQMLAQRDGSKMEVFRAFGIKYPDRGRKAAERRYSHHRDRMERDIKAIRIRGEGQKRSRRAISSSVELSENEEEVQQPVTLSSRSTIRNPQFQHTSSRSPAKRIRIFSPSPPPTQPVNAVASSSSLYRPSLRNDRISSSSHEPIPSFPLPSFRQARRYPPSTNTAYRSGASSPHSRPAPPPPPRPPQSQPHLPAAPARREPSPFLIIGSKPSTCSPNSSWCFFCGTEANKSETFEILSLATTSLQQPGKLVRVPGRLACGSCRGSYEKRIGKGKVPGPETGGEEGEGVLERLSWVTERLVEEGLEKRRTRVEGR